MLTSLVGVYNITQLKEICMCEHLCYNIGETFRCTSLIRRLDEQSPDFCFLDFIVFEYSKKRQTSFFKVLQNSDRRARVAECLWKRATQSGGSSPLSLQWSPMLTPINDPLAPYSPAFICCVALCVFRNNSIRERRKFIEFSASEEEEVVNVVV